MCFSYLIKLINDLDVGWVKKLKKAKENLACTRPLEGGSVCCCSAECPDNGITQDVGEIVNPLHVFVPMRLSWFWHDDQAQEIPH